MGAGTSRPTTDNALARVMKLIGTLMRSGFHGKLEISFQGGHPGVFHTHTTFKLEEMPEELTPLPQPGDGC